MKKTTLLVIAAAALMAGCSKIDTDANHESVLIDRPMIFGTGGVREETFKTGRQYTWLSTEGVAIDLNPFTKNETFDDLTTSEGAYVDFVTTLTLQVTNPVAIYKLGDKWYENNMQKPYQEIMRRAVRKYTLIHLRTDVKTQEQIDNEVSTAVESLITSLKLPVRLVSVNLGKATPNKGVLDQIDLTSAQQQRKLTMDDFKAAEEARADAEISRAKADNAYRNAMGLTPEMFIKLEQIKRFAESCQKANCTIINGVANPIVAGSGK